MQEPTKDGPARPQSASDWGISRPGNKASSRSGVFMTGCHQSVRRDLDVSPETPSRLYSLTVCEAEVKRTTIERAPRTPRDRQQGLVEPVAIHRATASLHFDMD